MGQVIQLHTEGSTTKFVWYGCLLSTAAAVECYFFENVYNFRKKKKGFVRQHIRDFDIANLAARCTYFIAGPDPFRGRRHVAS